MTLSLPDRDLRSFVVDLHDRRKEKHLSTIIGQKFPGDLTLQEQKTAAEIKVCSIFTTRLGYSSRVVTLNSWYFKGCTSRY